MDAEPLIMMLLVAPYAGAWIETLERSRRRKGSPVAPYAGAWIETLAKFVGSSLYSSRPLRGGVD